MKKELSKRALWHSFLSFGLLSFFILLALASIPGIPGLPRLSDIFPNITTYELGNGEREERHEYKWSLTGKLTEYYSLKGKQDDNNRWHGPITIKYVEVYGDGSEYIRYTEEVDMYHGKRNGPATMTMQDGTVHYRHYYNGRRTDWKKRAPYLSENSAYQVFTDQYPWYQYKLHPLGFGDDYMEAFLDTLEIVLEEYSFDESEFDDYYDQATEVLVETPYDSILSVNAAFSYIQGLEELKDSEFRLAVIERNRQTEKNTYEMVQTTYPGYLGAMHEGDVSEEDFEEFCRVFDSCMVSYGPLDQDDFFFVDIVDSRIFRAVLEIYEMGQSDNTENSFKKAVNIWSENHNETSLYRKARSIFSVLTPGSTPPEVAEVVLYFIFMQFVQGDLIKKSVKKAWNVNHDITSLPVVATAFDTAYSSTSVILEGYVFEDGGAVVTSRGIAWAEYHNPTTGDHKENSGTGTGQFSVTLEGLTEGFTYYARTFATNSTGTAYGNCVKFTVTGTSGIQDDRMETQDLKIYPNPASAITTFRFLVEYPENMVLTIHDLKGRVVYHHVLGSLPQGEHQVELDLSLLQDGMYHCQIVCNRESLQHRMFIIAR